MYRMGWPGYSSSGICASPFWGFLMGCWMFGSPGNSLYRVVGGNLVGSLTHGPKKLSLPSRCCRLHECLRPVVHRQGCGRVEEGSF